MANTYKATEGSLAAAHLGTDEAEHEFSATQEADWLAVGLEIVPRSYKVLSDNYEVAQGEVFEAALPVEVEAARVGGGHIERVDESVGYDEMTKADLQAQLEKRGLPVSGTKAELSARLDAANDDEESEPTTEEEK